MRETLCDFPFPVEHNSPARPGICSLPWSGSPLSFNSTFLEMSDASNWDRYHHHLVRDEGLGFSLDISRMQFSETLFDDLGPEIARAWSDLRALEAGEIANPDEGRQVGHYWLRTPSIAPAADAEWIERVRLEINDFAAKIHRGEIVAPNGHSFRHVLLVGIGGSALGPQLVSDALRQPGAPIDLHFLDNTDPAGIDRVLADLGDGLAETLVIVTSKSGGTPEITVDRPSTSSSKSSRLVQTSALS